MSTVTKHSGLSLLNSNILSHQVNQQRVEKDTKRSNENKVIDFDKCKVSDHGRRSSIVVMYEMVGDVDSRQPGARDAQLVPNYAKEIFSYLLQLEAEAGIRADFLRSPAKLSITPRMRQILFNWLVLVHSRLTLQPETLYLTFNIIDRYLSSESGALISKAEFQLLGITAMFLACKYEEMYAPGIDDFVYLTDNSYSAAQVRRTERRLLSQLQYFLGHPQPIQFLRRYSRVSGATRPVHEMAKYIAEAGRCAYQLAHLPASALAAGAFCLAVELLASGGNSPSAWSSSLEVFSGYSRPALQPAVRLLAGAVLDDQADTRFTAVRTKYSSAELLMVSRSPELSSRNPLLLRCAGGR